MLTVLLFFRETTKFQPEEPPPPAASTLCGIAETTVPADPCETRVVMPSPESERLFM